MKKNIRRFAPLALTALFAASPAVADSVLVEISGFPSYAGINNGENDAGSGLGGNTLGDQTTPNSTISFDTTYMLGYAFWDHLILGVNLLYSGSTQKQNTTPSNSETYPTSQTQQFWGATAGLLFGGFRIMGTYLFSGQLNYSITYSEYMLPDSSADKYVQTGGEGYQIEAGYTLPVWGSFRIGPTLIYRYVSFNAQSHTNLLNNVSEPAQTLTTPAVYTNFMPELTLMFQF